MGMDKDDVVIIPLNTFQRRISGNVRIPLITVAVEPGSDIERVKRVLGFFCEKDALCRVLRWTTSIF